MTFYHGTDYGMDFDLSSLNPSSQSVDICLTWDSRIAEMYATRMGSCDAAVVEIDIIDDLKVCGQDEALAILGYDEDEIREIGWDTSRLFHIFDSPGVHRVLEAAGFDAVEYDDCMPYTTDTFTCTRVFVAGKLSVYAIEMVEEVA